MMRFLESAWRLTRSGAAVAIVVVLAACTTQSEVNTLQTKTVEIAPTSVVALDVATSDDADAVEVAGHVRDQLFGKLVSRGIFLTVRPKDAPEAQYDMTVTVSNVEKVSVAARLFVGVFAGGDELTATVTMTDRATGNVINQFEVKTEAAAHWLSSEYGIDNAINQLTDQIVQKR